MKIVIPAYEPDEKLLALLNDIKQNIECDIILIDDGSSPNCNLIFQKASEANCTILKHKCNQGKGAALKTAFSYLLKNNTEDEIICADCDGQHTWQDIKKIADLISLHKTLIILGSREFVGKVPLKSLLGNKITRGIYSMISGCEVSDTQTGLRGFSAHMLPWLLQVKGNHYEYEMNQLLQAKSAGYQLYCVPIQTIYDNNNVCSHFRPVIDSIRIYLPIIKFSLSSIYCGIIDFILLLLFNKLWNNLMLSVLLARLISSLCNYLFNKNLVFNSKKQLHRVAIVNYYALVVFILICNYILISFFMKIITLSLIFSKLVTEFILFLFSYYIQHKYIFKHK